MQVIERGLVPVYSGADEERLVDARELHAFLESKDEFSHWINDKIRQGNLDENIDYTYFTGDAPVKRGRPALSVFLTMDAAKHVAMLQNTQKGKQVRKYFIEVEKRSKAALPSISRKQLAQMVLDAEIQLETQTAIVKNQARAIQKMEPKVEVYNQFMDAKNAIHIGTFAKVIKWGQNRLFKHLRDIGILFRRGDANLPMQEFIDRGYFELKLTPIVIDNEIVNKPVPLLTAKGQQWLHKKLLEEKAVG